MFYVFAKRWSGLGAGIVLAGLATGVQADGLVMNSGFEDDPVALNTWVYRANGWTITGDAGTFRPPPAAYPGGAPTGQNVGFVQSGWAMPTGILEQNTGIVLEVGQTAELNATIGRRMDNPLIPWGGYVMSLYAGDTLLTQDNTNVHPAAGSFVLASLSYTVEEESVGQPLRIRFESLFGQTNIDNVELTITPAPSAYLIGAIASCAFCRRRR